MSEEKQEGVETLDVLDTTATQQYPERTHELRIGDEIKQYTFKTGQKLALPAAIAMRFLKEPSFIVTDQDGKRITPPPVEPENPLALGRGETIARFDELSADALMIRCKAEPGGDMFKRNTGRQPMIQFLTERADAKRRDHERALASNARGSDTGEDLLAGGNSQPLNRAELDKMFEDA
jgi:hypothetical protein